MPHIKKSSLVSLLPLVILIVAAPLYILSLNQKTNTRQFASQVAPLPLQGIYESCDISLGQPCIDRLNTISKSGFKVVLNYSGFSGTPAQLLAYADAAQAVGLKLIWPFQASYIWDGGTDAVDHYDKLASGCTYGDYYHCWDRDQTVSNEYFVRYVVTLVKDHPATWGYYVADEPTLDWHDNIKVYSDYIHKIDPSHPRLVVAGSVYPKGTNDLNAFTDVGDVLLADYYPVGYYPLFTVAKTATIAKNVMAVGIHAHKPYGMVLQAQSWANYPPGRCTPFPTCAPNPSYAQMQTMKDLVLQNSQPSLLMWYSYFDILQAPNADSHWKDVTKVINTFPATNTPTPSIKPTNTPAPKATPTPVKKVTATPTPPSVLQSEIKRDIQRKSDLKTITTLLTIYYQKNKKYPAAGSCVAGISCYVFSTTGSAWIPALGTNLPVDPSNTSTGPWGAGHFSYAYGNLSKDGQKYDLFTQLENPGDPDRCGVKDYLYGAGIFTTQKHWCVAFGGVYSNQIYQLH